MHFAVDTGTRSGGTGRAESRGNNDIAGLETCGPDLSIDAGRGPVGTWL